MAKRSNVLVGGGPCAMATMVIIICTAWPALNCCKAESQAEIMRRTIVVPVNRIIVVRNKTATVAFKFTNRLSPKAGTHYEWKYLVRSANITTETHGEGDVSTSAFESPVARVNAAAIIPDGNTQFKCRWRNSWEVDMEVTSSDMSGIEFAVTENANLKSFSKVDEPLDWKEAQNDAPGTFVDAFFCLTNPQQMLSKDANSLLRDYPNQAHGYARRAAYHLWQKDSCSAIADLTKSISIDPTIVESYLWRAAAYESINDCDAAYGDLNTALRLDPKLTVGYSRRGMMNFAMEKYGAAIVDCNRAVEIDADNVDANRCTAFVLAACPIKSYRDGTRALNLAERACKLSHRNDWEALDALAASYAELNNFKAAIAVQEECQRICNTKTAKRQCAERIKLYSEGRPFRAEKSRSPTIAIPDK